MSVRYFVKLKMRIAHAVELLQKELQSLSHLSCVLDIIGVARILSGVHFLLPKKLTTVFSLLPYRPSKYTSKSKPLSKNCPKLTLAVAGGTSCHAEVHLHIFPVN